MCPCKKKDKTKHVPIKKLQHHRAIYTLRSILYFKLKLLDQIVVQFYKYLHFKICAFSILVFKTLP